MDGCPLCVGAGRERSIHDDVERFSIVRGLFMDGWMDGYVWIEKGNQAGWSHASCLIGLNRRT